MPDHDGDAWLNRLRSHADGYDPDLDALRARLAAELDDQATGPADAAPRRRGRRQPRGAAATGRRAPANGRAAGRAPGSPVPSGRPGLPRRLAPVALAAAVILAFLGATTLLPELAGRSGDGTVAVQGVTPTAGGPAPASGPQATGPQPSLADPTATTVPPGGPNPSRTDGARAPALPSSFRWTSTGPLVGPRPDATHPVTGVKDPSVVHFGGAWHVFATVTTAGGGFGLAYLSFGDWSAAGTATPHYLDRSAIGSGFRASPQVFWFAPQKLWYLVYQTGTAVYSTNPDITDPAGWTAPKPFYGSTPGIVTRNIGNGFWVDMWVICDATTCHLFSTDDNGHLYRSQTALTAFPRGMSDPVIALAEPRPGDLFEGSAVYRVAGTDRYLLLAEAFAADGRRYLRSWTSTSLGGRWTPLADDPATPFAGDANVTFGGGWTRDVVQGELLRSGYDQNLAVSSCGMRFLYHSTRTGTGGANPVPWRLALLTETGHRC